MYTLFHLPILKLDMYMFIQFVDVRVSVSSRLLYFFYFSFPPRLAIGYFAGKERLWHVSKVFLVINIILNYCLILIYGRHSESCDSITMANNEKWTLHHLVVFSLTFLRWVYLIQCSLHIQKIVYL